MACGPPLFFGSTTGLEDGILRADVVVIGSGGAGLVAACAAQESGKNVVLVTKSRAGVANCTAYAGGGFTLPSGKVSISDHRRMTLETGRFLNVPYMLESLSSEAQASVRELERFGVKLKFSDGHASCTEETVSAMMGGSGMTLPLVRHARNSGVTIRENAIVSGILTDDKGITGVSVLDCNDGQHLHVHAKAVILASGGAGRLYSRTDNPARTTGDGYALLYDMGVPLVDMEFVQFYPMGFAEEGFPVWMIGLQMADVAPVTNSRGEQFLKQFWNEIGIADGRQANLLARDMSARRIASEWKRGEKVLLHVEDAPEEVWQTRYGRMLKSMFPRNRQPLEGPVMVQPVQHYFIGGALVNEDTTTRVPGLFACGEVTGGTDGANRVGGNALSMISVFGLRAARSALRYVEDLGCTQTAGERGAHPGDNMKRRWQTNAEGPTPAEFKRRINKIADNDLFVVRSASGLRNAVDRFDELEAQIASMCVKNGRQVMEAYEALNLVKVGQMVARAALMRTESRGVHMREDYPDEHEKWLRHVEIARIHGRMRVRTVEIE